MKLKIGDKVRIKTDGDMTLYKIMAIDKDAHDNEYVSYMVGVYDETDYSDASWYEDELIFVGRASEKKARTPMEMLNLTKEQVLKVVEDYFDWQFKTQVGLLAEATEDGNKVFIDSYLKTLNNISNIVGELDLLAYRFMESED